MSLATIVTGAALFLTNLPNNGGASARHGRSGGLDRVRAHGDPAFAPAGDIALIETSTIHAANGDQLLGPYSRFGWNHPGPLYFYVQAPFYVMSGYRSAGLSAGALVINLAALGLLVRVCMRASSGGFLAVAISMASVLFTYRASEMLASQWNPHVLVLPTMAIVVVAAAVAAGRIGLLPVLAALASFVVQTHLGLGPAVLALSGVATAIGRAARVPGSALDDAPRFWPILNGTFWLLLLLWLLPLAQELFRARRQPVAAVDVLRARNRDRVNCGGPRSGPGPT